jgi:hypothetical protein
MYSENIKPARAPTKASTKIEKIWNTKAPIAVPVIAPSSIE